MFALSYRSKSVTRLVITIVVLLCWAWLVNTGLAQDSPIDPGAEIAESFQPIPFSSPLTIITKGGWLMIPILVSSFILLVFVFERAMMLRKERVIPKPFVKRFLHQLQEGQLDREKALTICEENRSPVAEVFAQAIRKWGRATVEIEQAVLDAGERLVAQLRRHLRIINGVATVAPLLGLLGTVTGMIQAFNNLHVTAGEDRLKLLSSGIGEALLTTAAGLSVAIPALIFHMYFVGKVDRLISEIDQLGQQVVDQIAAESQSVSPKPKKTTKRTTQAA